MRRWDGNLSGRHRAIPHLKTYTRQCDSSIDKSSSSSLSPHSSTHRVVSSPIAAQLMWFLMTSANLSGAAWGEVSKGKDEKSGASSKASGRGKSTEHKASGATSITSSTSSLHSFVSGGSTHHKGKHSSNDSRSIDEGVDISLSSTSAATAPSPLDVDWSSWEKLGDGDDRTLRIMHNEAGVFVCPYHIHALLYQVYTGRLPYALLDFNLSTYAPSSQAILTTQDQYARQHYHNTDVSPGTISNLIQNKQVKIIVSLIQPTLGSQFQRIQCPVLQSRQDDQIGRALAVLGGIISPQHLQQAEHDKKETHHSSKHQSKGHRLGGDSPTSLSSPPLSSSPLTSGESSSGTSQSDPVIVRVNVVIPLCYSLNTDPLCLTSTGQNLNGVDDDHTPWAVDIPRSLPDSLGRTYDP